MFYGQKKIASSIFLFYFTFDKLIKPYLKGIYKPILINHLTRLTHSRVVPFLQQCFKRLDQVLDHVVIKADLLIFEQLIIIMLLYKFPDLYYKIECPALWGLRGSLFHGRMF
jgi:hypothetical protein